MEDEVATKSNPSNAFVGKLRAYRDIILAIAALATAVGSWFRPTDTTATKNSFDWTSKQIEKLSADNVKSQQDLLALHNFLEGYIKGQSGFEKADGSSEGFVAPIESKPHKVVHKHIISTGRIGRLSEFLQDSPAAGVSASPVQMFDTVPSQAPEVAVEQLPDVRPASVPIKKPRFEDVAESK